MNNKLTKEEEELEYMADYLACLVSFILPAIDLEETTKLLFEMLMQEPSEELAKSYGELIRATTMPASKTTH